MPRSYMENLVARLALGLAFLPQQLRRRHAEYLRGVQNPDGGFAGREGDSDLYYTSFALRGLACLGQLEEPLVTSAARYLESQFARTASVVDFMSLLLAARLIHAFDGPDLLGGRAADWQDRVAAVLRTLRKADGGYGQTAQAPGSSTYHTFLVVISYELIERPVPDPQGIVELLMQRRREDGGFVEVAPARRGGTNPTAAALAVLNMLSGFDETLRSSAVQFLAAMQCDNGGLKANARAPMPDLLSSFTGLLTLADLRGTNQIDLERLADFVYSLELPQGGFRGGHWDNASDVEYTFYGLGCLGLCGKTKA